MTASVIDAKNQRVHNALQRLADVSLNTEPLLRAIGEDLSSMVKQTFQRSASPDGTPWAPNSEATMLALLSRGKGNFRPKDGRISAKGSARVMSKKPLIGESKALMTTIFYSVAGGVLEIGTPMEYGAMQHFGGKKAQFPNLWGDIPGRPFMPITPDEQLMPVAAEVILDNTEEYLAAAWRE